MDTRGSYCKNGTLYNEENSERTPLCPDDATLIKYVGVEIKRLTAIFLNQQTIVFRDTKYRKVIEKIRVYYKPPLNS